MGNASTFSLRCGCSAWAALRVIVFCVWLAGLDLLAAAAPGAPGAPAPAPAGVPPKAPARTNAALIGAKAPAGTNAAALPGTNSPSGLQITARKLVTTVKQLPAHPAFYPVVGVVAVGLIGLLVYRARKPKAASAGPAPSITISKPVKAAARKAYHACNVLEQTPETSRVWLFDAKGAGFTLRGQETTPAGRSVASGSVAKDWRNLFQPRLNIAWLPHDQVFLRVIHLPQSDFTETLSMVELQLEKLSPMPVAQIVWSIQVFPHTQGNLQTVIVIIVARSYIEEFLGKLEAQSYLADRLELPLLDELQATPITDDGAYVYPEVGGERTALVAWWYGGVLQSIDLLTVPETGRSRGVREQLLQMAWAGELDGWMQSPPRWHLVADGEAAATWEPLLHEAADATIERDQPLASGQLAALTAKRGVNADSRANLLPPEFAERYRNQYIDRLWMRGVAAVLGLYLVGIAIYFIALQVVLFQTRGVENAVVDISGSYTNALRLRDQYLVLKDRQELKYAALDIWVAVADCLPDDLVLENLSFTEGKRVTLRGTVPSDKTTLLGDFQKKMLRTKVSGQPLFRVDKTTSPDFRPGPQGASYWSCNFELSRAESQ